MVKILEQTNKNPLQFIGQVAGICWSSDISDTEKNKKRALDCINSDHGRVMEYVDIYMVIDGYSARVIREWYTHIGGAPSRLQESTRYVDEGDFGFVTPSSIKNNPDAVKEFNNCMNEIKSCYKYLQELNIPKEDIAMCLPLGMTTKIVDRRNLRNLADMSKKRLCSRAYSEYRQLFSDIIMALNNYSEEWRSVTELLFKPQCEYLGYCPEKKCCGRKQPKITRG